MSKNKDLDPIMEASYSQIREWLKKANSTLAWRLHSRGFNKRYVKAQDVFYIDDEGQKYLDFLGGFGLNIVGHNHPRLKKLISDFLAEDLPIFMQAGHLPGPGALADKLTKITGLDNCFFANSGTEVVEAGIKLARKATGRKRVVYAEDGFHGKTLGSLSITARPKYQKPYEPLLPKCTCVPFNNLAAIEKELRTKDVAVVILEPIQGEGGIQVPDKNYLKNVRELCDKYQTLLFLDEIQTGMGRTGSMFAYQEKGIKPDILTLAKGLSGCMIPIGALITKSEFWQAAFGKRKDATQQTSTFGGNNLATSVALTTIKIIEEEKLAQNAQKQGKYLLEGLEKLKDKHPKLITAVRGKGLLVGVEFSAPKNALEKLAHKATELMFDENIASTVATNLLNRHGILTAYTLNNTNVLRFEPALTVKKKHIDDLLSALDKVLGLKYWGILLGGSKIMVDSLAKK
ncbi:MAG: aspartate aminotransferase family protein [Actinobacteria bacterium]|nr:MAG: aspartate aminotransferase family protein [Actinomycetota bacterium]